MCIGNHTQPNLGSFFAHDAMIWYRVMYDVITLHTPPPPSCARTTTHTSAQRGGDTVTPTVGGSTPARHSCRITALPRCCDVLVCIGVASASAHFFSPCLYVCISPGYTPVALCFSSFTRTDPFSALAFNVHTVAGATPPKLVVAVFSRTESGAQRRLC